MVPFVLLALADAPAHGYVLAGYLAELGFRRAGQDPSVVYRVLRQLADDDAVTSEWTLGDDAPPRRIYRLTPTGEAYLHQRAVDLHRQAQRIVVFLDRYRRLFPQTATDPATTAPGSGHNRPTAGPEKQQRQRPAPHT